ARTLMLEDVESRVAPSGDTVLPAESAMRWIGGTAPHPVLQEYFPPGSKSSTISNANPRGYFRPLDPRRSRWSLGISHEGSTARLVLPDNAGPDAVRVEVSRTEVPTDWHIQLSYHGVALHEGDNYVLNFRARAD